MSIPSPLLETIIMDIGNTIKKKYDKVKLISIHLKKIHPPVSGIQGSVAVSWKKEY
jgi:dihydroneopterin aldolase